MLAVTAGSASLRPSNADWRASPRTTAATVSGGSSAGQEPTSIPDGRSTRSTPSRTSIRATSGAAAPAGATYPEPVTAAASGSSSAVPSGSSTVARGSTAASSTAVAPARGRSPDASQMASERRTPTLEISAVVRTLRRARGSRSGRRRGDRAAPRPRGRCLRPAGTWSGTAVAGAVVWPTTSDRSAPRTPRTPGPAASPRAC